MRAVAALVAVATSLAAPAAAAWADEDEASMDVHLVGGVARTADPDAANDEVATTPLAGLTGRFSYATSDWFQYEAALTLAGTGAASYAMGDFAPPAAPPVSGPFSVSTHLARLELGATMRFGVRFIPTLRVFAGAQARHRAEAEVDIVGTMVAGRDAEWAADLVGGGELGFDYRVNRRLVVGVALGGTYALPVGGPAFQTVEGFLHGAYYFYPRW